MGYTTALFDLDGTLLDFNTAERNSFFKTFKELGIPCNDDIYMRYSRINDSLWKAFERGEISKEAIGFRRFAMLFDEYRIDADHTLCAQLYKEIISEQGAMYSGALELCQKLLSKGVQLYAVTNGTQHIQRKRLAASGLDKVFIRTFVSEDIGYQKPDKEYFDYVFKSIAEKDKRKIIIIGDSPTSDIKGGTNAGIDTCYFADKSRPDILPTYITNRYEEIERIIIG